jgi:hypothetical protein
MFSSAGFWVLFWAEFITTTLMAGARPIDYPFLYPSLYSYVGEHLVVWGIFASLAHFVLSRVRRSPFTYQFASTKVALPSYLVLGLSLELGSSLFLWHDQSLSREGVRIFSDPLDRGHALRSFLILRTEIWAVAFFSLFVVVHFFGGRRRLLNSP